MSDMASVYERHRITLDEYHRMAKAGVFDAQARIELIDGELIEMAPIDPPHASTVDRITHRLVMRLGERAWVRCQNPVTLRPASEPQPDLVLARRESHNYCDRDPEPADTLLAIEVSKSSLRFDRKIKVPLYARSGIRELWLVNVVDDELAAYREPADAWYASVNIAELVAVKGLLIGTTYSGGIRCKAARVKGCGTVFSIDASGTMHVLHAFTGAPDGANPEGPLTLFDGKLYGTTFNGGSKCADFPKGCGVVYSITTSGKENVLYRFKGKPYDGTAPTGNLVDLNGTLYGTTIFGGLLTGGRSLRSHDQAASVLYTRRV
jgi:uncharacterized repeat protein (TIGR03803 family)